MRIAAPRRPRPTEVVTRPFPGFPTDMQAQFMAALCLADGTSHITETIYPDRYTHVAELRRLGADIRLDGATATIFGVTRFSRRPGDGHGPAGLGGADPRRHGRAGNDDRSSASTTSTAGTSASR